MRKELYIHIENFLNKYERKVKTEILSPKFQKPVIMGAAFSFSDRLSEYKKAIEKKFEQAKQKKTLYETIVDHIHKLNNPNFYFKSGKLNESAFCEYAHIDKSTWSGIVHNSLTPKKKTLFKLIFALKLNMEDAEDIIKKGRNRFDETDRLDLIVMALIEAECYDIYEVYDVIEEYRIQDSQAKWPIDNPIKIVTENIYDGPEEKKLKREKEAKENS